MVLDTGTNSVLANQAHPNLSSSVLDSNIKDSTNNNIGLTTFPFDPNEAPFRRGKLKEHLDFWKNEIQASEFVLDIIKHGHKPTLRSTPEPYSIPNRSSALKHKQFVNDSLRSYYHLVASMKLNKYLNSLIPFMLLFSCLGNCV